MTADATQMARRLAARCRSDSAPRSPQLHLLGHGDGTQLLVANGSRLYRLAAPAAHAFRTALEQDDETALQRLLQEAGLAAPPAIDDTPLPAMPVHALSLAIAQKCNLGCTYCYAQQGSFGGPARNMEADVALRAVDALLAGAAPGARLNLAFMGGEPLGNRAVLRRATVYASELAARQGIQLGFSITTNGTLLRDDDADFFEQHGFAVTVSMDGPPAQHDRLRPFKGGAGSFEEIEKRLQPLLQLQRRMQVSARVTVTPFNMDLPQTLDFLIGMGFHSVGFSPLLRAPNGAAEMDAGLLDDMLEGMIGCGLAFERHVLRGERYPFLNMVTALRELQRGTHRPYPCGAGAGYFGVAADGALSACHRFVGDAQGQLGHLDQGIDRGKQAIWLAQRHVHTQSPCSGCWARYLCGGGCHHEVLARGRHACNYIRGWLHYTIQAHDRLQRLAPGWESGAAAP